MDKIKVESLLLVLMAVVIVLLITNVGLFLRMNQLQERILGAQQPPPEGLRAGVQAPALNLKDLQGQPVKLESWSGKPVLLVFSSVSCSYCQKFWPTLQQFHRARPDLALIMISRGTVEENQAMVKAQSFDFPVLQWEDQAVQAYQVPGTPYLYLVGPDQKVSGSGYSTELEQLGSLVGR